MYFNAVLQKLYTLYIFDEPFSGLDITSVLQIKKLLKKLSETHIVLFASHILETLSDCKEIYLLHEGNAQIFLPSNLNKIEDFLSLENFFRLKIIYNETPYLSLYSPAPHSNSGCSALYQSAYISIGTRGDTF